ncbi:MAG: L,D-transpeptidase family protein [Clostridia bacterium]|nr:L,D-transpeptidase family protein [Clostridia bacterium]
MKSVKKVLCVLVAALIASAVLVPAWADDDVSAVEETSAFEETSSEEETTDVAVTVEPVEVYAVDESSAVEYVADGETFSLYQKKLVADPDGDGEVTASDARLVLRLALSLESASELGIPAEWTDIDLDGEATSSDARLYLRYAIGFDRSYVKADGSVPTGWFFTSDGKRSYFTSAGTLYAGMLNTDEGLFYLGADGFAETRLIRAGDVFYCAEDGSSYDGFYTEDGKTYYFRSNVAVMGFQTVDGSTYYFGTDGVMTTGFCTVDGSTYYFGTDGKMRDGLRKIGGSVYYFGSDGKMRTGLTTIEGFIYLFGSDGRAKTGWQTVDGGKYFFDENNVAVTGFAVIDGKEYYFGSDGKAVTGWQTIDGNEYYFYDDGSMAKSTTIDGIELDANGYKVLDSTDALAQQFSSRTNYLIMVDRTVHKLYLYEGSKGNWTNKFTWLCSDGAPSSPTTEGEFTINYKGLYFIAKKTQGRCWYYSSFNGNYLIHSVLYSGASEPIEIWDGRLGMALSEGCVRLDINNAKWIYDNCPIGTKVVVYHS